MTDPQALSEREMAVLRLVAEGATNQQIAHQLAISTNTVKVHLRNVYGKLGVESRTEATVEAVRRGLIVLHGTPLPAAVEKEPAPSTSAGPADLAALGGLALEREPAPPLAGEDAPLAPSSLALPADVLPAPEADTPRPERREPLIRIRSRRGKIGLAVALVLALGLVAWGVAALIGRIEVASGGSPTPAPGTPSASATSPAVPGTTSSPSSAPRMIWSAGRALPEPRAGLAAVTYSSQLYVVGGEGPAGVSGAAWSYDPEQARWEVLAAKPLPVADVMAGVIGQRIFVPGGRTKEGTPTSIVEVYDTDADRWEQVKPLPQPRSAYGLVALDAKLYLFGGLGENGPTNTVFVYDPSSDQWGSAPPLIQPLAYPAVAATPYESSVLVVGGEGPGGAPQRSTLRFTPNSSQTWEELSPLPAPRSRAAAAAVGRTLYLLGGAANEPVLRFDLGSNRWSEPDLTDQRPLGRLAAIEFEGSVFALGGEAGGAPVADNRSFLGARRILLPDISSGDSPTPAP